MLIVGGSAGAGAAIGAVAGGGKGEEVNPRLPFRVDVAGRHAAHSIEQLAAASPEARSELERYLAASGRDSVASQDFLPLCKTMLRQARAQGVQVEQISSGRIFALCK